MDPVSIPNVTEPEQWLAGLEAEALLLFEVEALLLGVRLYNIVQEARCPELTHLE